MSRGVAIACGVDGTGGELIEVDVLSPCRGQCAVETLS
jgi:hypothetical protein